MGIKNLLRKILATLGIDLTQNMRYDRLTKAIFKRFMAPNSNAIDIGCHKGEILDLLIRYAPQGNHVGFEPIPDFFGDLKNKYAGKATIYPYALSNESGTTQFNFVKNAPAYSGIKQREYKVDQPDIATLSVELKRLDDVISPNTRVDLIKIDVEGGEFNVMLGAKNLINAQKPLLIFESGLGASEFYGTSPDALFDFLHQELNYDLYKLQSFIDQSIPFAKNDFVSCYRNREEYYFVAKARL